MRGNMVERYFLYTTFECLQYKYPLLFNELLKNYPTPTKSNHKQVQFGFYNNLVICCLIGKIVQNEVKIEDILPLLG